MALRAFYNEMKGLKVRELPAHLKAYLTIKNIKSLPYRFTVHYHNKYIKTNSIDPLYHVCFGGMAFSYLVALPEERRHLAHQEHLEQQKKAVH